MDGYNCTQRHGVGLSIIFPAWMKYVYKHDINKFVQFVVRVFNVQMNFVCPENTVLEGMPCLEAFFKQAWLLVRFSDAGISDDRFKEMVMKATKEGASALGNFVKLGMEDIYNIYMLQNRVAFGIGDRYSNFEDNMCLFANDFYYL